MSLHAAVQVRFPGFFLDIDFSAPEGSFVSLLGPSGCGKTTALRALAGLQEAEATSLSLNGTDLAAQTTQNRQIGFVFQDYALFPHLSVHDNVAYGPRMRKWNPKAIKDSVEEKLRLVDLEGYGPRRINELSGGEQQRVALARALAPDPKLLFLDEPLSALDRQLRQRLRRDLRRIQRNLGITTLYVTHDQEEALSLSDILVIMKDGSAVESGPPEELYRSPETGFTAGFLGIANFLGPDTGSGLLYREALNLHRSTNSGPSSGTHPQEEPVFFFRPEDAVLFPERVDQPSGMAGLSISGRVLVREYLGDAYFAEIESSTAGVITAKLTQSAGVAEDDTVELFLPADKLKAVRAEKPEAPAEGLR